MAPDHFPYAFTPVAGIPWHARYRAEGRSPLSCFLHGIHYMLKYHHKLESAPPEEIACFDRQRTLLRALVEEPAQDGDVPVAMVGDIMWIVDGWRGFLSDEVLGYLNGHAAVLGNLETTIATGLPVSKPFPQFYLFNSDPALLTSFRRPDGRNTFTALATCNNHTLDFGDRGAIETLRFLDSQGILHSGVREQADQPPHVTFTVRGIRVGFYAATWGLNSPKRLRNCPLAINAVEGLAPEGEREVDLSGIRSALAAMEADGAELRVVYLHWGFEYELYPTPRQMQAAREIVRAGADVVMGSHTHVQQPAEALFLNGYERRLGDVASDLPPGCLLDDGTGRPRKALVVYSLGNFATDMMTFLCRVGMVRGLRLRRDPDTGRIDWHRPHGQLVYNVPKGEGVGQRKLVLLRTWLRDHQAGVADDLARLLDHVVAET